MRNDQTANHVGTIIINFSGACILKNLSSEAQQNIIIKRNREQGREKVTVFDEDDDDDDDDDGCDDLFFFSTRQRLSKTITKSLYCYTVFFNCYCLLLILFTPCVQSWDQLHWNCN